MDEEKRKEFYRQEIARFLRCTDSIKLLEYLYKFTEKAVLFWK